jgi:hypothetical protein
MNRHYWLGTAAIQALLLATAPLPAIAQALSPAQMQTQLSAVFPGTTVAQNGSDYAISVPITGMKADNPADYNGVVIHAHPGSGTAFVIDSATVPSAFTLAQDAKPAPPPPGGIAPPPVPPVKQHVTVTGATLAGTFDPAYATPSAIAFGVKSVDITIDGPDKVSEHLENESGSINITAASNGLVDIDNPTTIGPVKIAAEQPDHASFTITLDGGKVQAHVGKARADQIGPLLGSVVNLLTLIQANPPGGPGPDNAVLKPILRKMLGALNGLAAEAQATESFDDIKVVSGVGKIDTLANVTFGFGGNVNDGLLQAYLELGYDGLVAGSAPPEMQPYLPSHFHIRPVLSGVASADLFRAANAALSDNKDEAQAAPLTAMMAAFGHGGLKLTAEAVEVTMGPTIMKGRGSIVAAGPSLAAVSGDAYARAENLDALIETLKADKNPDAAQALQAAITARAMGKPDANGLVWKVDYKNGGVQINGVQLVPPNAPPGGAGMPPGGMPPHPPRPPVPGTPGMPKQ